MGKDGGSTVDAWRDRHIRVAVENQTSCFLPRFHGYIDLEVWFLKVYPIPSHVAYHKATRYNPLANSKQVSDDGQRMFSISLSFNSQIYCKTIPRSEI